MSRRYPKNRKKQGGARRALLVFLLTVLILAALVLGTLALLEALRAAFAGQLLRFPVPEQ